MVRVAIWAERDQKANLEVRWDVIRERESRLCSR